ncbi:MAG: hypothetical protein RIE32_06220 [Phycisphaerales bacterium]
MSDNPYAQPNDFAGGPEYLEPKTSILAVFAFVISLVGLIACCIPGVGPLGLLLGVLALVLISTSGGRKKGGGLAIAAIVIGLIAGAINIAIVFGAAAAGREWSGLGRLVEAVEARDLQEAQSYMVSSQAQVLDEAMMDDWGDALNAEYGSMQSRPEGMWELIQLAIEVGPSIETAQADAGQVYSPATYAAAPLALPFDQGTVLFMVIIPNQGSSGGAVVYNIAFQAPDDSLVWLIPVAPQSAPSLPGGSLPPTDPGDPDDSAGEAGEDETGEGSGEG